MLSVMPFHNPSCYLRKVINWSRPVSEYFSSHYLFIRLSSIPWGGPAVIPGNTISVNLTLGEHPSMASLGSQGFSTIMASKMALLLDVIALCGSLEFDLASLRNKSVKRFSSLDLFDTFPERIEYTFNLLYQQAMQFIFRSLWRWVWRW